MIYYRKTLFGCGPKLTAVQRFLPPLPCKNPAISWFRFWQMLKGCNISEKVHIYTLYNLANEFLWIPLSI